MKVKIKEKIRHEKTITVPFVTGGEPPATNYRLEAVQSCSSGEVVDLVIEWRRPDGTWKRTRVMRPCRATVRAFQEAFERLCAVLDAPDHADSYCP